MDNQHLLQSIAEAAASATHNIPDCMRIDSVHWCTVTMSEQKYVYLFAILT